MPLWSVSEVAVYLGVTTRTVYRLLKQNRLPAYKVGGQWRFREDEMMAWLAANRPITKGPK